MNSSTEVDAEIVDQYYLRLLKVLFSLAANTFMILEWYANTSGMIIMHAFLSMISYPRDFFHIFFELERTVFKKPKK